MKMYHWRGEKITNFGDELNLWMWPKLLPGAFDADESSIFLGIGSILFDHFPREATKIVMGAGYAGYSPKPLIDETWKIHFVRGPLTAEELGIDRRLGIGDAAILMRSCSVPKPAKRYPVSFMPHWESVLWGDWTKVCERAEVHLIDPCAGVDRVLEELLASEIVISEAMHGVIVSDALRVPWIAIEPIRRAHRMKWQDWSLALGFSFESHPLRASNAFEWAVNRSEKHIVWKLEKYGGALRHCKEPFASLAVRDLKRLSKLAPSLSPERLLASAHDQMLDKLEEFKLIYARQDALQS